MGIFIAFVRKDHSIIVSYLLAKKKENEKNMNVYVVSIAIRFFLNTWIHGLRFRINITIDCVMCNVGKQRWDFI